MVVTAREQLAKTFHDTQSFKWNPGGDSNLLRVRSVLSMSIAAPSWPIRRPAG
jgi:hypothetical protein